MLARLCTQPGPATSEAHNARSTDRTACLNATKWEHSAPLRPNTSYFRSKLVLLTSAMFSYISTLYWPVFISPVAVQNTHTSTGALA